MKKRLQKQNLKRFAMQLLSVFVFALFSPQLVAANDNSILQSVKISINLKNASLSSALYQIEKASGYNVLYNSVQNNTLKNISISAENRAVADILNDILSGTKFTYNFDDNKTIVITERVSAPQQPQVAKSVAFKGRVIDSETKKTIAGATVLIKNSTRGAISDDKGMFTINAKVGDILSISYVGMKDYELKVTDNGKEMTIEMLKGGVDIEEVIVTGYQEVKKSRMTGSAETITSKDIANKGYSSIEDALKGSAAGVTTMNVSGRPGAAAEIRIRGINSITGNSDPIWIVDGMPLQGDVPQISIGGTEFQQTVLTNGIGNIPPDDIESITILKDAAATAIYGSRAANGVIVIKTKRGSVGKSTISINSSFALEESPKAKFDLMNTAEKIAFERSIYEDFPGIYLDGRVHTLLRNAANGEISSADAEREIARLSKIDTDWYDEVFRVGQRQNHSISLSGGSETTQYYSALSYLGQKGIMPNNKYESIGASLKLTHDFNKFLRINLDIRSSVRNDIMSAGNVNPLQYATFANPYERLYDENGNYEYDRSYNSTRSSINEGYKYDFNIMKEMESNTSKSKYLNNQVALKLEFKLFDGMMFSSHGTYSNTNTVSMAEVMMGTYTSATGSWLNTFYPDGLPENLNNGRLSESTSRSSSWTIRNQLEYARGFGVDRNEHFLSAFIGQEASSNMNYRYSSMIPEWNNIYGIASYPDLTGYQIKSSSYFDDLGSHRESQDRSVSFYAMVNYSYKDRYVIGGSGRLDGADVIGTANRFSPLWEISGKWNLHNEEFFRYIPQINQLAIRVSYGFTGKIDRNVLPYSLLEKKNNYYYDGEKIMDRYTPASPSIKWERKEERNIGLDASLLRNRLNIVVNYYNNDVTNLIGTDKINISTGYSQIKANIASINNTGWEFTLKSTNIKTRDFSWSTSFNFSYNKNRITKTLYNSIQDVAAGAIMNDKFLDELYIKDKPVGSFFGYEFAGIDPSDGTTLVYVDGFNEAGNRVGSLYKDGRYVVNLDNDRAAENILLARDYLGTSNPPYFGGFNTQINYKRFSASASFSFFFGHTIKSYQTMFENYTTYGAGRNSTRNEMNRWRKPGDITNIAKYDTKGTARVLYLYDNSFEKGDYLKCNNISLGYNLGQQFCDKIHLSRLRINFNMQNPFTVTNYRGADPENRGAFGYPVSKVYNISLSIGI